MQLQHGDVRIAGAILCGGQSRRMGSPKAWLVWEGRTLLELTADRLAPLVDTLIVSAAAGQKLPNLTYPHVRVEDAVPERGPIEGLRAALTAAGEAGCTLMYALSVDLPLLDPALLARLRDRLDTGDEAIVPLAEGFRQPLCALYRVSILPTVERVAQSSRPSLQACLDAIRVRLLEPADYADLDPSGRSLRNWNRPEDWHGFHDR
jgi:molybdopterin-guanine dinucleotide biosynthesis protein A